MVPRTVAQAEALEHVVRQGQRIDAVIELKVDEEALVGRLENIAEMKAASQEVRGDDNAETLRHRLATFREQTAPIIPFLRIKTCCARLMVCRQSTR